MGTTLTIRNLEEPVKQKLRIRAASHGRSMEAEARAILTLAVSNAKTGDGIPVQSASERMNSACESVRGIWKGRGTSDELMRELRGEG